MADPTKAAHDVLAERQRQIEREGWSAAHDDEHDDGSLALAAACYAAPMATRGKSETADVSGGRGEGPVRGRKRFAVPLLWPDSWDASWWKPKDRRSNLVRAAALLLAEIERMDRAAAGVKTPSGWKLVPVEPTPEMCAAATEQGEYDNRRGTVTVASNIYRAMVNAAPAGVKTPLEGRDG